MSDARVLIRIRALTKSFGQHAVFAGLDAELREGQVVALVGGSGCGKSTLLRCLNALEHFDAGQVEIGNHVLTAQSTERERHALRAEVGMVFQDYQLFPHLSAIDNVALAPRVVGKLDRKSAEALARRWLERVGLADRAGARPHELSGGQRQRVALARALAQRVRVLLLDEPTSALDPALRCEIRDLLRDLTRDTSAGPPLTSVLVTHDLELARQLADVLWQLEGGRITEIPITKSG